MNRSLVGQLVRKDFEIMKVPILCWWVGGLVSAALPIFGGPRVFLASMILFVTAMAGAGFHTAMQTVLDERRTKTLPFIMSLPITVREYTSAKLLANLVAFGVVWMTLTAASFFVIVKADSGLPLGSIPFVAIVLVGIVLAYTIVLTTGLVTESLGITICAVVAVNLATQLFLWWVVGLDGIRSTVQGPVAVWSNTTLTVLGGQAVAIVGLIWLTYELQKRKRDFI